MKMLFSGGSKSGKSCLAETAATELAGDKSCFYIATMLPRDDEDLSRIQAHIKRREGKGFITIECGRNIERVLDTVDKNSTVLVDSVTALYTNEMFPEENGFAQDADAERRCTEGLLNIARSVKNAVFVTDYVFSDAFRYDDVTEAYRKSLANICRALAKECDSVTEAVFSMGIRIK